MIGVFDSGFGGLTIQREILKKLPQYDYMYLGDNARAPYGNKSQELIYQYTVQAVDFLFKNGCELVIIACNTASTEALRKIQQEWMVGRYPNKKVLGVVVPVVESVARFKNSKIGLIGTRATINSGSYEYEIKKIDTSVEILKKATPLLVSLVEEGWHKRKETKMILRRYLRDFKKYNIDKLILGCTHYPVLIKEIRGIMGKKCEVIDSPKIIAKSLDDYLRRHSEVRSKLTTNSTIKFYTTDNTERFKEIGQSILGMEIQEIRKVTL